MDFFDRLQRVADELGRGLGMRQVAEFRKEAADLATRNALTQSYKTDITDWSILRDINLVAGIEQANWKQRASEILGPTANIAQFASLEGPAVQGQNPAQAFTDPLATVTFVSGDFSPFNGVTYCPVPNRGPVTLEFRHSFTLALAATPGSLLISPGIGTALSAKNLGAGVATATLGTSGTAGAHIDGLLSIYKPGATTTAQAFFSGKFGGKLATSGNGTEDVSQRIGNTALGFDSTAANGLWMTMTGTATSVVLTTRQLLYGSWN